MFQCLLKFLAARNERNRALQGHSQAGKAQVESLTQSSDVPREQFHRISTQLLASLASLASLA